MFAGSKSLLCIGARVKIHHSGLTKLPVQPGCASPLDVPLSGFVLGPSSSALAWPFSSVICQPEWFCKGSIPVMSQVDGKSFPYLMDVLPALVSPCQGLEAPPVSAHPPANVEEVCFIIVLVPLHFPACGYASRSCAHAHCSPLPALGRTAQAACLLVPFLSDSRCVTAPCNSTGLLASS